MPDMERILDDLELGLQPTEEKRQFTLGKIAGKRAARIEIAALCAFALALYAVMVIPWL